MQRRYILVLLVVATIVLMKLLSIYPAPDSGNYTERIVLTKELYESGYSQPRPELCPQLGVGLSVLILVASAPCHVEERNAVRQTWGYFTRREDVAMAFMLGASPSEVAAEAALEAEQALYGDMIVGNCVDSYTNLTLKTLSMLEWAATYCPHAPRLLKSDDDEFINVPRLLEFLSTPERVNATLTLWGFVIFDHLAPWRSKDHRHYLSPVQFPATALPTYASGSAYLLTSDAIQPLLKAAPAEPYVPLEDIFVTGILADKVGIRFQYAREFSSISPQPCSMHRDITRHVVYRAFFKLWRRLLDLRTRCRSEVYPF